MNILVIDGQGGGIGKQRIVSLKTARPNDTLTAVETNGAATSVKLKSGADDAAIGENTVIISCRHTDVIVSPVIGVPLTTIGVAVPLFALTLLYRLNLSPAHIC
ncbi:MAG: DUF3842 family protein [Clostridiaceae bacterium]